MTSPLFATKHRLAFSILTIWVLFCAVVVLGLDARLIKRLAGRAVAPVYGFTLAAVCITLLTLLPLIVFGHTRPAHTVLQLRLVLGLLFVLWVFWLAFAAGDTDSLSGFLSLCGNFRFALLATDSLCSGARALIAFAWIGWVSLTALFFGLLAYTIVEHNKGHRHVWSTSAYEYPFGTTAHKTSAAGVSSKDEAQPQMTTAVKEEPITAPAPAVTTV